MNFAEGEDSKRYCIKTKHVAIICAVVVAVGLIVGLSVGLTRSCALPEDAPSSRPPTASPPTASTPTASPPQDQGPCPASDDESGAWKNFRLPDFIIPVHYDLEVRPVMEEDTYTGNVTIEINVTKATRHLWLHLRETRISQLPVLRRPSGTQVTVQRCFEYKKQEYVVVEAEEELTPSGSEGLYRLTMNFAGWLNGSLVGFYRTTYVEKGQIKSIAATDHEPTDARKSFPCFDEPNKKATYTISIIHTKDYKALSNMPMVKEESVDDRWTRTTFQKSVPMSTYLVCFAVHQFDYVQRTSKRGIPLTVYVQPEQKHTAEYAANVTKSVFDYFEEYFAMDYALPKLDEIAIPDFGTGAMENWGLITYRETNLLYDPQESASSNKQRVASVVAHELVHQWFGNIVTMEWWEDLWLNEGFASFFEYLGVNHAEGDWQMRDQMLLEDVLPVQEDDSLMSSHPIVITVSNPDEITSAFDGISYSKGASILRMLEDWISPENFQRGCQAYLEKYKFKNAKTSDFWGALEEASNLPVKEVMDTWTTQMGYPVLNVENKRTVMQKRFLLDARADLSQPPSDLGYTWNIPVKWTEDNVSNITFYNRSETRGITLNPSYPSGNAFLKINPDHIGFYRVNYEAQTWDLIATNLNTNPKGFSSADRASLIDDAFALARAQLLDYKVALNLTKYLKMEEDFLPWQRVISAVTYVISMFEDDKELYPMIEEYFRDQVKPVADTLTWNDTGDHLTKLLRASVLGLACKLGDTEALDSASQLFQQWLTGTVRIPVNLRLLVYRYGMQSSGNETSWNYTLDQYQKTSLAQEKEKLLYALASVRNITLLSRHIDCGTKIEYNMISTHEKLKGPTMHCHHLASGLYVNSAAHCSKVVYQELDHLDTPQNTALIYYVDGVVLVVPDEKISKYLDALLDSCELKGERYLDLLKDSNLIKTQDVFTVIRYISYNSYGKNMAWNWIQHNWEYLVNRYTLNDRNLGRIVTIAEPFNTELQLWEVESFFKKYPEAGAGETPRQQVLETVRNNIEWVKQNRKSIAEWFGDLPKNGSNILF